MAFWMRLRSMAFDEACTIEFTDIYRFNFKGNARTSGERRRREGGNIFLDQIRVGVGISILIRKATKTKRRIYYHEVPDYWTAVAKTNYLRSFSTLSDVKWTKL